MTIHDLLAGTGLIDSTQRALQLGQPLSEWQQHCLREAAQYVQENAAAYEAYKESRRG